MGKALEDRLLQLIGFAILLGLTLALVFSFREGLLPSQEDGDVFGTVYVMRPSDAPEDTLSEIS